MRMVAASLVLLLAMLDQTASAECPIAADRKPYVQEIVSKLVFDLTFVTGNVHFRDRGFALSLFGVDEGSLGQLLLAQECTKRHVFRPTYERREDGKIQRSRVICEASGIDVIQIAIASGRRLNPSAFKLLQYSATRFQGVVLYDPFPSANWRSVKRADGDFSISAEIFRHLSFTPTSGALIDLTHSALLTGRVVGNEPVAANAHIVLPAVTSNSLPLIADVRINEIGIAMGTAHVNGETVATISGSGFELSITWTGECAATAAITRR